MRLFRRRLEDSTLKREVQYRLLRLNPRWRRRHDAEQALYLMLAANGLLTPGRPVKLLPETQRLLREVREMRRAEL